MRAQVVAMLAFTLLVLPAPARGDKEKDPDKAKAASPKPVDISKIKDKLVVYHDGKSHYLVLFPSVESSDTLFIGDGKTFHLILNIGFSSSGGKKPRIQFNFWDPRVLNQSDALIEIFEGKATVHCDKRKTSLTTLSKKEAAALIEKASFFDRLWTRTVHAVARDDHGNYYLVDREWERSRSRAQLRDLRLFVGPRGKMKQMKMKNVVADGEGEIFSTKSGDLRFVTGKNEIYWIAGKKRTPLTRLDVGTATNRSVIYNDLGVYLGQRLGTPCDDF